MPTIITTPGAPDANSYADVAQYKAYWQGRTFNIKQLATADPIIEAALVWSGGVLDAIFNWTGSASTSTQAMSWPRTGMLSRNGFPIAVDAIPPELIKAQAEFAGKLVVSDTMADNTAEKLGIIGIKAGPVEVRYQSVKFENTMLLREADVRMMGSDFYYLGRMMPDSVRVWLVPSWYVHSRLLPQASALYFKVHR